MKLLIILFLGCFGWVSAQNYTVTTYTGDDGGYWSGAYQYDFFYLNGHLSTAQNLPFAFNFYGQPVSSYRISETGYIIFDAFAGMVDTANTALPNPGGPNHAIYAMWDNFTHEVTISTVTYGIAPNRVHQITWAGLNYPGAAAWQDDIAVCIKLYESCHDFEVIVIKNSIAATSSFYSMINATIGCENSTGSIGTQVSGSPNYIPSNPNWDETRYEVHRFSWNAPNVNDVALIGLSIDHHLSVGSHTLKGTVRNEGDATLAAYNISYSLNGGTVQTSAVTGLALTNSKTHEWTHTIPISIPNASTQYELKAWIHTVNGGPDEQSCNDTLITYITGINQTTSPKKVLLEKFTGTWCGHCIDGAVFIANLRVQYRDDLISLAIHSGDSMEFAEGMRIAFAASSYPSAVVDRSPLSVGNEHEVLNRGQWNSKISTQLTSFTPVEVEITNQWNPNTRVIDATVTANYSDHSAGDARIILMVVEDSVRGVGAGWDQANYYDQVVGHPYFGAGGSIVGYHHRHVLRDYVQSGPFGVDGIIPHFVRSGSTYQHQFQYTLPSSYDPEQVELVAAVVYYMPTNDPMYVGVRGQRTVLNATATHLNTINSVVVLDDADETLLVYPNPTNDQVTVVVEGNTKVELLKVYNATGQLIQSTHRNNLSLEGYPAGIYILEVHNQDKVRRRRIIKRNP